MPLTTQGFPLAEGTNTLYLPANAKFVSIASKGWLPYAFYVYDPLQMDDARTLLVAADGDRIYHDIGDVVPLGPCSFQHTSDIFFVFEITY